LCHWHNQWWYSRDVPAGCRCLLLCRLLLCRLLLCHLLLCRLLLCQLLLCRLLLCRLLHICFVCCCA
jgi:hypothetical protein